MPSKLWTVSLNKTFNSSSIHCITQTDLSLLGPLLSEKLAQLTYIKYLLYNNI